MMNALAVAASVELLISLALAWLGAFAMYLRPAILTRLFPRPMYLIKTHIDFLLMALLMWTFFGLGVPLPSWVIACTILGSLSNPSLFLVLAVNPNPNMNPLGPLGLFTIVSFIVATLGFGGTGVILLAHYLGA